MSIIIHSIGVLELLILPIDRVLYVFSFPRNTVFVCHITIFIKDAIFQTKYRTVITALFKTKQIQGGRISQNS